jgi:hypothetical protein
MRYLKTVFGLIALLFLPVVAINYCLDPIGIYHPEDSKPRPVATVYARLGKAEAIKRLKPDALITGTSRADIGLDPRPEFFPGLTPYNSALSAATIYEQRRTLEFAQAVHPLRRVIITLDFFAFNAHKLDNKQFDPSRLTSEALKQPRSFFDSYGTVVALDTFLASIKHLRFVKQLNRRAYSEPNGHKVNNDIAYKVATQGAYFMFEHPPAGKEMAVDDFTFSYSDKSGDDSFQHLSAMLDFARINNIKVFLLLSPIHQWSIKSLEDQGKAALVEQWKKCVIAAVRDDGVRHNVKPYPLWDFATRNSITREPVPTAANRKTQMKWWWDPSHYKTELGDIVLRKVLSLPGGNKYPDFGRKLL